MSNIKNIAVDLDSLEDCLKIINMLKSTIGTLRLSEEGFISKNERMKLVFNACMEIYSTDISGVYNDLVLDPTPKYYVYAHCDPGFKIAVNKEGKSTFGATLGLINIPFYIGKGTGNRSFELDRNESHRKVRQKIKTFYDDIDVKIIASDLTEVEALMLESKLIDIFGLTSFAGRLVNLDEGHNSKIRKMIYKDKLDILSKFHKNSK